jgi:hypothetical protein
LASRSSASRPSRASARTRASATRRGADRPTIAYLDAISLKLRPDDEPAKGVVVALGRCEERVLFAPQAIDQPAVGHVNVVVRDGVINRDVGNQDTTFRYAHR